MGKYHKDDIEWKKLDTEEYILYDSIYLRFRNRQN